MSPTEIADAGSSKRGRAERVLVTGAAGFVGRAVVARLRAGGHTVHAAVRRMPDAPRNDVTWHAVGEVDGATDWTAALADVDAVIHLVARTHAPGEAGEAAEAIYRRVNVEGTRALAEQARAAGVRRVVFASSIKVNGERTTSNPFREVDAPAPEDVYGRTKLQAERALASTLDRSVTEYAIVRAPIVYGPGVPANIRALVAAVLRGYPLPFARVDNRRSLVGVRNLADALAACLVHPAASNRTYLVSDGDDLSTPELIRRIADACGVRARLLPVPPGVLHRALILAGRRNMADKLLGSLQLDTSRIQGELNWRPPVTAMAELRAMAQALRDRG